MNKQQQRAAQWDKENMRHIKFKFHLRSDADVIARLESQENIQGYIKALIRADIARSGMPVEKPE